MTSAAIMDAIVSKIKIVVSETGRERGFRQVTRCPGRPRKNGDLAKTQGT